MCQALEELYQDGILKGEIKATIELCQEFGMSLEATLEKIKVKHSLGEEKAREYIDEYWK